MKITVLLSTYNGQRFLQEQIESVFAQDIATQADMTLLVRDDGSQDATCAILKKYSDEKKLQYYTGTNIGVARSFWNLLKNAPRSDYYAFCDQDDFWFSNKLSRAAAKLDSLKEVDEPLLYCSSYIATDSALKPFRNSVRTLDPKVDFAHALLYSVAPGCTFVFNDAAREAMLRYDMEKEPPYIHDWMAHKIVAMLGTVVFDETPSLYYRQHGGNVIGVQRGLRALANRCRRFFSGESMHVRSDCAQSLLKVYAKTLLPETAAKLDVVANYRVTKEKRKMLLHGAEFRTGRFQDMLFFTLVLLRKL